MSVWHPKCDDHGRPVRLLQPDQPGDPAAWMEASAAATAIPEVPLPAAFAIRSWQLPQDMDWEALAGGMPLRETKPERSGIWSAGALICEPDGRVWLVSPSNQFGGYRHTFPKGKRDPGASLKATALKEVWEESGLKVRLTAWLGDFSRSTSTCRMYLGVREGGSPSDMGWESQAVHLVPEVMLKQWLNDRDLQIVRVWQASRRPFAECRDGVVAAFAAADASPSKLDDDHFQVSWSSGAEARMCLSARRLVLWRSWLVNAWRVKDMRHELVKLNRRWRTHEPGARLHWRLVVADGRTMVVARYMQSMSQWRQGLLLGNPSFIDAPAELGRQFQRAEQLMEQFGDMLDCAEKVVQFTDTGDQA